ncbi:probable G-protein coupled receptor AH9.1 [Agrilus planipennis]|uniref:Probable G-protein coupled receptor AH9.1 n=1 Tax=Agrilus planipennis TaxID=224129 RepID=A0A1W4XUK9_AGRPL|nr:probable G-protein coupled receptor AH9.1 [Agrilus planipennis]
MDRVRLLMVGFTKHCGGDIYALPNDEKLIKLEYVAYTILSPIIIIVGIICNCINLLVLSYPSVMKGAAKIYLRALAIADLCALLGLVPVLQRLNKVHNQTLTAAFYYAHLEVFLVEVFIRFSTFIVVCMSFDRYLAICLPEKFNDFHSTKFALKLVGCCFVIATIITLPLIFIKVPCILTERHGLELWDTKENPKVTHHYLWNIYIWCYELIAAYGVFLIIAFCNLSIIGRFQAYMKKKNELHNTTAQTIPENGAIVKSNDGNVYIQKRKQREENRLVFTLQLIVLLFFLTMTPSVALSIIYYTTRDIRDFFRFSVLRAVGNNLLMLYLTLNFFIYSFCHKQFRIAVKKLFCRCFNFN